jgi:putative ABC transport system ATP-binding protein
VKKCEVRYIPHSAFRIPHSQDRRSPHSIHCEDLTLTYITPRTTTYAVRGVNLRFGEKSFAGIVGPSGSGKSSLLYLLSGLKTATSGEVYFGDFHFSAAPIPQRLEFRRQNFGFVFQQPFLIPYLNLLENILVPVENPQQSDVDRAYELLEQLGLAELAPKFPNECSGGERVRASIARGLVHRPQYLFVDEPTANLDLATGARVMHILKTQREHGALIIVTHDLEILDDADVIFRMRDGALTETYVPQRATA